MKKLLSFIATLLAITMIFTMFSMVSVVSAVTTETEVWDGTAATSFAGGDGTATNPFLIENGAQLVKAVTDKGLVNGNGAIAYYMIINDIYLNEDYENYLNWANVAPKNDWNVVKTSNAFAGHLDGGYHTIYGMYYSGGGSYGALVPYLSSNGTISNLIITNSYSKTGDCASLFAARLDNATISNCIARDSYIYGKTIGGIVGWASSATNGASKIENCGAYNLTLTTSGSGAVAGGIIGKSWHSYKKNAYVRFCFSGGKHIFGSGSYISITPYTDDASRCYTDVAGSSTNNGLFVRGADQPLTGENALTNMPRLSTSIWKTTDSYPTLVGNGTKGETWRGGKAALFAGGKGTQADPFLIETGEQLYKAITDNGTYAGAPAYYLITADIYLNKDYANYLDWATTAPANNWSGTYSSTAFSGHLDGGYHTIYGMYYNLAKNRAGLVPYVGGNGTVSNIIVANSYSQNNDSAGIFTGRLDTGKISNCIAHDSYIAGVTLGGIVGWASSATAEAAKIENCGAYNLTFATTATSGTSVGGILGKSWNSANKNTKVSNCYSAGKYIFGNTSYIGCTNSYTDIDATTDKYGVTDSNPAALVGANAVTTMGFSTTIWKATDTYPTFALNNGTEGETWTGAKAARYNGGSGTKEDPYKIATAEQLYKAITDMGKDSSGNALYYLVVADIYLNKDYENYAEWGTTAPENNWNPTRDNHFVGHLDGGLHTIYGLYALSSSWQNGLIPIMNNSATVSNVIVANAYVRNTVSSAGGIVGGMLGTTVVDRCMVYNSVISAKSSEAAGIVAKARTRTTTIKNCATYNVTLDAPSTVGGILAKADQGTSGANGTRVYNCYSIGNYPIGYNDNLWCNYVYTDVEGGKSSITTKATDLLMGATAATTMKYFDFINTWETTESGYPVLRQLKNNNLNQEIAASYSVTRENNKWAIFTSKVDMPKISPEFDDNIYITIDGVEKKVQEVGVIVSRKGFETSDISTVTNTPITGYKIVGYTNGADNSDLVTVGGQIEINAIVNGTVDYTAKSYIIFADDSVVLGDLYDAEPSTEEITIDSGIEVSDVYKSGDANFDNVLNLKDLVRFKKYSLDAELNKEALFDVIDIDSNKEFNANDILLFTDKVIDVLFSDATSDMELVFEDNFDTLNLDTNKWDFTNYMTGYGVETVETSDVQKITSENGDSFLRLTSYKTDDGKYKATKSISTGNKLTFVHGYLEIRAKVPTVQGAWPSLWLKSNTGNANLGYDSSLVYNTEVDVFEVMGGNKAISEIHKWKKNPTEDIRYGSYKERESYAITDNDWHTYGMLWTEDEIVMSVDGVTIQTYDLNSDYEIKWPWDTGLGMENFKTQPLCITLNNYLFTPEYAATDTGAWAADYVVGDDFTESVYDIDYVRLYQDSTDANSKLYKAN